MAWAYDSEDFEYEDWLPYAVYEGDDVLVIRSEGDYFFALAVDVAQDRWEPLPIQSDRPHDLECLRLVAVKLLHAVDLCREQLGHHARIHEDQASVTYKDEGFLAYRESMEGKDLEHPANYQLYVRDGDDWRRADDYDTVWGFVQQVTAVLLRLRRELAGTNRR